MSTTALSTEVQSRTGLDRIKAWTDMPDDMRRREAAKAANEHDAERLWTLTDAYLTLHGKAGALVSEHTRRNYHGGLRHLVACWYEENLLRPSRDAGALWIRGQEAAGDKHSTITVRLAAARMLYRALRWSGATESDPLHDVRTSPDPVKKWEKREPYQQEEIDALLRACRTHGDAALVLLGAHGGLRASEIVALVWTDISFQRATLTVRSGKGRKSRLVALSPQVTDTLGKLRDAARQRGDTPDDPLFPFATTMQARRHMEAICSRGGVDYKGLHSLRHYCGTRLVHENGGNLEVAREHLGHSSVAVTEIYSHMGKKATARAVEGW
jgi:integrase/recombinase XerC